jgi:undecaprenyl diphosphate synthase
MVDPKLAESGSEDERLLAQLDEGRLPRHVAIIMDGNGRWARQRRLPRVAGHRAGIQAVRETIEVTARLGIEMLTLYAFSRENWKRPETEIEMLMKLLREFLAKELAKFHRNNIRLSLIGRPDELPGPVQRDLEAALDQTSANTGLELCVALSYSGREEIIDACKSILRSGVSADAVDADMFADHLYTAGKPEPDLLIRTSGEMRVSNFLLWQIAYAEIWVTETLWPDFRRQQFFEALLDYQARERRFGGLSRDEKRGSPTVARS